MKRFTIGRRGRFTAAFSTGRGLALLLLLTLSLFAAACGNEGAEGQSAEPKATKPALPPGAYEVVDARGDTVRIPTIPKRVLTFTTGADEIVLGLIKPDRMIAVNEDFVDPGRSNVSALAKQVKNTIERNPTVERVAALQPDLVIVQDWIPMDKVQSLRDLGIPVVVSRTPRSIDEVRATIRLIAASLGEKKRGEALVDLMDKELIALQARLNEVPLKEKGKTVALVSIMPAYGGAGGMFDDVIRAAGGQNAKALAGNRQGQAMTKEQFVACNPDYIFLPSYNDPRTKEEIYGAEYMSDPSLSGMKALREHHLRYPWARYIYNISQNVVFGVQEAARMLYGEQFAQPPDRHLTVAE